MGTPIFCPSDKRRVRDRLLKSAQAWQYVCNFKRPHFGKGMGGLSPLAKLQSLGCNHLDDNFLLFPVILLD
ncbi:hypothetical protein GX441_00510 [bacterium]|nr:hypothetical protein [bacterium]